MEFLVHFWIKGTLWTVRSLVNGATPDLGPSAAIFLYMKLLLHVGKDCSISLLMNMLYELCFLAYHSAHVQIT